MRTLPHITALVLSVAMAVHAQESRTHADFRGEAERFKQSCGAFDVKNIFSCAELLFTDHPLHIAVGSLAPQNGFGAGAALVGNWTPNESWRTSWDTDAVGTENGSWRAGFYFKAIHTPVEHISVITTTSGPPPRSNLAVHPYTVFNAYAQSISLDQVFYYGLGQNSRQSNATVFGMRETIAGVSAIVPLPHLRFVSLLGEMNGRFVDVHGNHHESSPSIERIFTDSTAPGLAAQPAFAQFGEGARIEPTLFGDRFQLDYLAQFQQFVAPGSQNSFRRFTADLGHTIPLYRNTGSYGPKTTNGPDECAAAVGATKCPSVERNRYGSIGARLLIVESVASAGNTVPFYLDPTLGGSDVNGNSWLPSYNDYRFRAPNAIVVRGSFEHSIWGPIGAAFNYDQGKVALARDDIDFSHMAHSFAAGLTVRAGGLPALSLSFAWAGPESTHTIATVNNSLLGGSARPSLF